MDNLESINQRLSNIETLLLSNKTVLNLNEVAAFTGLSKSYLYKLTCTGGIPCYKPNSKQLYFNKQEIEAWLMQNRNTTSEELEKKANDFVTLNPLKK